jgi:hypothetical protein
VFAPKGLEDPAQGFNPGNQPPIRRALKLKGRQIERAKQYGIEARDSSRNFLASSGRTVYFQGSQG